MLGADATETAFKRSGNRSISSAFCIWLSTGSQTHSTRNVRSASCPGIATQKTRGDDGLLQVREIMRLRLNAELVTLSACDSGVGKLQGQEGISNLAEAFLVAGSRSVSPACGAPTTRLRVH